MNDNEYSNYGIHASVRNFKSSFRNFFFFFERLDLIID